MAPNLIPPTPTQPLSIGNVVSAGVRLYRSHLKLYFGIALRANLWLLLPILLLIPLVLVFFVYARNNYSILWLIFPIGLILFIYPWAKYLTNSALISRLAFSELASQPESVKDARLQIQPRLWSFLLLACLVGILLVLVYVGLAILALAVSAILALLVQSLLGQNVAALLGGFLGFLLGVCIFIAITWFYSRWWVCEVSLAVEERIAAGQSIDRSWKLTNNSVFRIQGIVLLAFAITIPLIFITNYMPSIFLAFIQPGSSLYWLVYSISLISSLLGNVLIMPFWQAIKAVVYYDLRSRREGLGLQLRDREF